jgi:hypothetical protein
MSRGSCHVCRNSFACHARRDACILPSCWCYCRHVCMSLERNFVITSRHCTATVHGRTVPWCCAAALHRGTVPRCSDAAPRGCAALRCTAAVLSQGSARSKPCKAVQVVMLAVVLSTAASVRRLCFAHLLFSRAAETDSPRGEPAGRRQGWDGKGTASACTPTLPYMHTASR